MMEGKPSFQGTYSTKTNNLEAGYQNFSGSREILWCDKWIDLSNNCTQDAPFYTLGSFEVLRS